MKTEVKKIDRQMRKLSVEVSKEVVSKKIDDVYSRIGKDAQVPGFRKGKAPREVLEKHYKDLASQEAIKELIPEAYNQAVEKEAIAVLNCNQISDVKMDNGILSFNATVEMKPEIRFKKDYKGIRINYKDIKADQDDVKRRLESIKESRKVDSLDDNFARSLGYPRLEDLQATVNRQILSEKDNQQRIDTEEEVVNYLIANTDFEVPASLITQQVEELTQRQKVDLALRGVPKETVAEQEKTIRENLLPQAERQVKVYLILEEIAKKEKIAVDKDMPHRVLEFLFKNADWKIAKS